MPVLTREKDTDLSWRSADGLILHGARRPGPGPSMVLVHGVAMDGKVWRAAGVLDALGDADVTMVELRGRGRSARADAPVDYSPDRQVEDLLGVLDVLPRAEHTVLGMYFGGRLALEAAAQDTRITRAVSFCAHGEQVEIPAEAVEEEAAAIEGPDGHGYLRRHFTDAGAPKWMVDACGRTDTDALAAVTRGLCHGGERATRARSAGQDLILVTSAQDIDLPVFQRGAERIGARVWLLDSPTRVQAAHELADVAARVVALPGAAEHS